MFTAADLPMSGLRARVSASIDRALANCAGTVDGVAMRGLFRRGWVDAGALGVQVASTRCTLSIDAGLLPAGFAGQSQGATAWHDHAETLYLASSSGEILTDANGEPLEGAVTVQRRVGAPVVIEHGEGVGAYTIADVQPADGGRLLLLLEVSA